MTHKPSNSTDFLVILNKIERNLTQINVKLDKLLTLQENPHQSKMQLDETGESWDVMTLLSLPDHLRKTVILLHKLGKATAGQVSEKSGRSRAIESSYLNQLVVMGHAKKKRIKREVYFYIE